MNTKPKPPPIGDNTDSVNPEQLRAFVERFERLETEKTGIKDAQKDVMAEAAAYGYDPKILRKVITIRKKDPELALDEDAKIALYRDALGC